MTRRVSTDFSVGQLVRAVDPDQFLQPLRNYLKDRVGTVTEVCPVKRPDAFYAGHVNSVYVKWHKRNGRGKECVRYMYPQDIEPAGEEQ